METICRANWQNIDEYPDPKSVGPRRWAWEFLRRNADYEADWQRLVSAMRTVALRHPEISGFVECLIVDTADSWNTLQAPFADEKAFAEARHRWHNLLDEAQEMNAFDPPLIAGETYGDYLRRVRKSIRSPLARALGKRWGVEHVYPPTNATNTVPRVSFLGARALGVSLPNLDFRNLREHLLKKDESDASWLKFCERTVMELGEEFPGDEAMRGRKIAVSFDLQFPVKPQIESALRHLEWLQGHLKTEGHLTPQRAHKKQPREWLNYLRALDAAASGVKLDQIVKVLLPNEADKNTFALGYAPKKKIEAWLAAGGALVESGYQEIALIPVKRPKEK